MSRLDDMIARARQLPVNDAGAQRYVAELARWARRARPDEPKRSRAPWFAAGFAFTAAVAVIALFLLRRDRVESEPSTLAIGERVAIVAEPNTRYRVLAA